MTDKVQIIKEEIKRLYNLYELANDYQRMGACSTILDFIDSLSEESEREDLEEYAKKLAKGAALDKHNLIWMCKKGAEWQKQKDEELFSEDIWNYIEENYSNITEEEKLRLYDVSIKSRLAGADTFKKYIREEMMKNAVECVVEDWCGDSPEITIPLNPQDFKTDDKVKIVICKTEQQ